MAVPRIFPLFALAALAWGAPKFATRKVTDEFVGAWTLVSFERRAPTGEVTYPMGQNPVGRLAYDAMGRMSAQIMRADRPNFQTPNPERGSVEEKAAAFDTYIAYYGTFTVDEANHMVIHHVEASLFPNWTGTEQRRLYEFSGDQLILRVPPSAANPGVETRLVWQRAR